MAVEVRIPTILRSYTGGEKSVQGSGATLAALLDDLESRHAGLRERLVTSEGSLNVRCHRRLIAVKPAVVAKYRPPGSTVCQAESSGLAILETPSASLARSSCAMFISEAPGISTSRNAAPPSGRVVESDSPTTLSIPSMTTP